MNSISSNHPDELNKTFRETRNTMQPEEWGKIMLIFALMIGGWLRFLPVLNSPFPLNDGGMFYTLIDDLLKNHFALPATTTYNQLGIPFAYPPLGFYIGAGLKQFLNISPVTSMLWLPAIASTACIAGVYQLALAITKNPIKTGLATILYAMVPLSSEWLLMGGGLTRALGMLFLLFTIHDAYQLFNSQNKFGVLKTATWGSLTVLSHPEMAMHAIGISLLFLLLSRSRKNTLNACIVALFVVLLTAPWWFTILQNSGLDPFLQAPKTGFYNLPWMIEQLSLLKMVPEENLTIVGVAGILGLTIVLTRKEFLLPLFVAIPYLADPRNANSMATVPVTMLAAIGILDLVVPALKNLAVSRKAWGILAVYFILVSVIGSHDKLMEFTKTSLARENQDAMQWVKKNIPPNDRFLVITGNTALFIDPTLEWFPAFAEHQNISTIQGREWIKGEQFFDYAGKIQQIQNCYWQNIACLENNQISLPAFDYLFLPKQCAGEPDCTGSSAQQISPLYLSLTKSNYRNVYENSSVAIFTKKVLP